MPVKLVICLECDDMRVAADVQSRFIEYMDKKTRSNADDLLASLGSATSVHDTSIIPIRQAGKGDRRR